MDPTAAASAAMIVNDIWNVMLTELQWREHFIATWFYGRSCSDAIDAN
jgi:hypothetical protein